MPYADPKKAKDYHREYMRRYLADPVKKARRNAVANRRIIAVKRWLAQYKLAHGCVDCGYKKNALALDIVHTDGKTRVVCNLKSIAAMQAEIERHACVVRCANCHRIKSHKTKAWLKQ